jgi:diguanylate cyclase (GGDEF)-like protein
MAISGSIWMMATLFESLATSLFWKEVWWVVIPIAILNTLLGLFFFSFEFSLRLQRVPRVILFSVVFSVLLIIGLSITNNLHQLMWAVLRTSGGVSQVYGPLYLVVLLYIYLLALVSLVLLVRAFIRARGALRIQTILLIVGLMIPVLVSVAVDIGGWNPLPFIDETALSFVLSVILFGLATLRFNEFFLLPIATDLIIKNMSDGVLVTDLEERVIFCNPKALLVLGKTFNQIRGMQISTVLKNWQPTAYQAWVGNKTDSQLETNDPERQFFRLTISNLSGSLKTSTGHLLIMSNITGQKNVEINLQELAMTDHLTGLSNRRHFFNVAGLILSQAKRYAHALAILIFDIDNFKKVNDTYGHAIGDKTLKLLAECITRTIRSSDVAARYGGDEFVILLPETDAIQATRVGERLRLLFADQIIPDLPSEVHITISVGASGLSKESDNSTIDTILEQADRALYNAKQAGGNQVHVFK